ncbi:MAG: FtsX-like permease family protein [Streptococcus sp.]|nr:FtsX-like permease family protein [Streptococcus sp.]
MFKLINKLAVSNLIKNRKLYYPFALVIIIMTTILYSFISLAFNPNIEKSYGGNAAQMTLQFGIWVIQIAAVILVIYANGFVMKNRSKELGVYTVLGMEKRHLLTMTIIELFLFALLTVGLGVIGGLLIDRLLFVLLLKFIGVPIVISSLFQWSTVLTTLFSMGCAFGFVLILNFIRLFQYSSLNLLKEKRAGEKKGRFLLLQTIIGSILLVIAYYIAISVENPVQAISQFFLAVLMVILATYLLFNAGSIKLLQFLKNRKTYYYQTQNFISLSNLIFRMKKNAMGLATISILSTMLLVTLVGSLNIYVSGTNYLATLYPKDYNISLTKSTNDFSPSILEDIKQIAEKDHIKKATYLDVVSKSVYIKQISNNKIVLENTADGNTLQSESNGAIYLLNPQGYKQLTGKDMTLEDKEIAIFSKNLPISSEQNLEIDGKKWNIKQVLENNIVHGKIGNTTEVVAPNILLIVVNDLNQIGTNKGDYTYSIGIDAEDKDNTTFLDSVSDYLSSLSSQEEKVTTSANIRFYIEKDYKITVGSLFFIGLFLSAIFLMGTVLIIYYKQISEGYEDRESFLTLQKVGLDEKQIKQTIRKQILTVFFLPVFFAFLHIAFAFKMIQKIVFILGGYDVLLLIQTTIAICLIFLLAYISVFLLTSRSYRRIISR